MNFLTHLRACSLIHENLAQGPQTVHDLPTQVGTFASPGWVPQEVHDGRSNEFFKALHMVAWLPAAALVSSSMSLPVEKGGV
jgi:hypothetical protein